MPYLLLKEVPRYECLQAAAARVPGTDPAICQVFLNILHTGDVVSREEASFLAPHGLNQARLIILVLLDMSENESLRSSELAEEANVSRATITGLLDTLEKAALVARTPRHARSQSSCVRSPTKAKHFFERCSRCLFSGRKASFPR